MRQKPCRFFGPRGMALLLPGASYMYLAAGRTALELAGGRIVRAIGSSDSELGTFLREEGWRGREIFGLAKEESRVKGLGNGYF